MAVFALFSFNCNTPDKNCEQYKNGSFRCSFTLGDKKYSYRIDREGINQTETDEYKGTVSKYNIKWTDECTYELLFLSTTDNMSDSALQFRKKSNIKTEILTKTDSYYTFKAWKDNIDFIYRDTLWVIKD